MDILGFIFASLIAGYLAFYFIYGQGAYALLIGLLGAIVGSFILSLSGHPGVSGLNLYGITVAFIAAVFLLALFRVVRDKNWRPW